MFVVLCVVWGQCCDAVGWRYEYYRLRYAHKKHE